MTVDEHRPPPRNRPRAPYRIITSDDTGQTLTLTYFNAREDYLRKLLPEGEMRYVSGTAEVYDSMLQMVHPDRVVDEKGFANLPLVEPVYPLTEGLAAGNIRRAMEGALARLPDLPEWQDEAGCRASDFPHLRRAASSAPAGRAASTSFRKASPGPGSPMTNCSPDNSRSRCCARTCAGRPAAAGQRGPVARAHFESLPYTLTHSQQQAVDDIVNDLARPQRMLRLLQGDVGSGKTVVALLAAADVIEAGRQAALMAPTEILARQHLQTIAPLAEAAGLRVAILTGRERGGERSDISTGSRSATSICWSALMRYSRTKSRSAISRSPSSTSSTASACISASRWRKRATPSTCWCSPRRRSRARWC